MRFSSASQVVAAMAVVLALGTSACSDNRGSSYGGSTNGNGNGTDTDAGDTDNNGDGTSKDDDNDQVDPNTPPPSDTAPPDISSVSAVANTVVRVVFSETVDAATVVVASFHVQGAAAALTVTNAELAADARTVTLTLGSGMQHGATYTLLVQGVSDSTGNVIANATKDFLGRGIVVAELAGAPAALTTIADATVTVSGTDIVAYQYALSGPGLADSWSAEAAVASSIAVSGLADGAYTLKVVGKDSVGNWQGYNEPTVAEWVLDTVAPIAVLGDTPPAVTSATTAAFTVGGDGVVVYKWILDGGELSLEASVASGLALDGLDDGVHTLAVIGRDAAGNWQAVDDAKAFSWTVDPNASTAVLSGLPANPTNVTRLEVGVGGNGVASYVYSLDGGAWSAATDIELLIEASGLADGEHTLEVVGSDAGGIPQDAPTTFTWSVDTIAPVATLTNVPSSLTNATTTHIVVGDAEVVSFIYTLDAGSPSGVYTSAETINLTGLGDGSHTLAVVGVDAAGNWQTLPTTLTWTVDTTPPTAVLSAVTALTNSASLSVTVSGADVTAYKYELDGAAWTSETSIASAITADSLAEGSHTLSVIGRDAAGNWQSIAAATSVSWTVDTTPPTATLNGVPPTLTSSTSLDVNVGGCDTYRVSLDGGAWSAVVDALVDFTVRGLAEGTHSLAVIGADAAGNWQVTPTSYTWTIDTTAPSGVTLTNVPSDPSNDPAPQIGVSGTGVLTYAYALDGAAWSAFVSITQPIALTVGEGSHTLAVRGKDGAGNVQSAATVISWTVDLTPPSVVLAGVPASLTNSSSATITVAGADYYSARLDGGAYGATTPVATTITLTGLADGTHTLDVIGRDAAGNWQTSPTTASWTVDRTPPVAPTVRRSGQFSSDLSLTYTWTNPSDATEVAIQVAKDPAFTNVIFGGANGASLGTAQTYDYIADSDDGAVYYARVRVRDAAQNWSAFGTASEAIHVVGAVAGTLRNSNLGIVSGATVVLQLSDGTALATTSSDASGNFTFANVDIGLTSYRVVISATGYNGATKSNISVLVGAVSDIGIVYLVSTTASPGTIAGTLVDANAGARVTGATVKVIDWTGTTTTTASTSSTGTFTSARVSPGTYTLLFSKTGFFDLQVDNVVVDGDKNVGRQAICQVLAEPQVRVVLLWGSAPADLDLHVVGPTAKTVSSDGTPANRFHVYWNNQKSFDENTGRYTRAADANGAASTTSLVQDDQTAYGPEAINLFGYGSGYPRGIYTFTVHDYSNTNWYAAPITARIYDSQGLVQEIPIPTGGGSNYFWRVFKMDVQGASRGQRTISVSNTFTSAPTGSWNTKSTMDW